MAPKTTKFDVADYLESKADLAEYLSEALALEDPAYFHHALGAVARAKGMATIARKSGLGRQSLYKALSEDGNPEFSTVISTVVYSAPPESSRRHALFPPFRVRTTYWHVPEPIEKERHRVC